MANKVNRKRQKREFTDIVDIIGQFTIESLQAEIDNRFSGFPKENVNFNLEIEYGYYDERDALLRINAWRMETDEEMASRIASEKAAVRVDKENANKSKADKERVDRALYEKLKLKFETEV